MGLLGAPEQGVHRRHAAGGRAVVGAQGVVAPGGVLGGLQVAADIGTPEAVDGLLWITDQQQRRVDGAVLEPVDAAEDAVLHRVGVLELVHQGHRELAAQPGCQGLAPLPLEGLVEAGQQVVEAEPPGVPLGGLEAALDPAGGVGQQRLLQGVLQGLAPVQGGEGGVQLRRQRGAGLQPPFHAAAAEGLGGVQAAHLGRPPAARVRGPAGHGLQQRLRLAVAVPFKHLERGVEALGDGVEVVPPGGLQGFQLRLAPLQQRGQFVTAAAAGRNPPQHPGEPLAQGLRRPPEGLQQQRRTVGRLGVDHGAPVVPHRLGPGRRRVGGQLQLEQAAAVEGVLPQHAVAPAVDGGHRRLVHPLRRLLEAAAGLGTLAGIGVVAPEPLQQRVRRRQFRLAETAGGIRQPGADALAQLPGGRVGEGHHQDAGRRQGLGEGVVPTVPQHQAKVQGGDGEGLAGAGAGLDEPAAVQGQGQGVQPVRGAHGSAPPASASHSGWYSLRARASNSPAASSARKSG